MKKIGLVLEGGGMRGIYTAGVLDVFMEHGLRFDGVIGVSAGAIHGCSFLSGQKGRSIRYYKKYASDKRFMSIHSFITTGNIVGVDFCYHELPDKLDVYDHEAFLSQDAEFYATVTNIETGRPEHIRIKDMKEEIDVLRASASLPYLSQPVEINGGKYLDGGCSDSVPIEAFMQMGYEYNVIVLTREGGYRKKPGHGIAKLFYRKYPALAAALIEHHNMYNREMELISEFEKEGRVFVIRPEKSLKIGRREKNSENFERVYNIGRLDAEKHIDSLKEWISKNRKDIQPKCQ